VRLIKRLKENKRYTKIIFIAIILLAALFIYTQRTFPNKNDLIEANKESIEADFLNSWGSEYIQEVNVGDVERVKKDSYKRNFLDKKTYIETYTYNASVILKPETKRLDETEIQGVIEDISPNWPKSKEYITTPLFNKRYSYDVQDIFFYLEKPDNTSKKYDVYQVSERGKVITKNGETFDPIKIEEDRQKEINDNRRYDAIVRTDGRYYHYEFVTWEELESKYREQYRENNKTFWNAANVKPQFVSPPAPPLERHQVDIKFVYEYDIETGEYTKYRP